MTTPNNNKRPARRRKPKETEAPQLTEREQEVAEQYVAREPQQYKPPENMVALNDERYLKKDRVGKQRAVRGPGVEVSKPGLGNLRVIHQNPIDYYGNLDIQPNGPDAA